MRILVQDCITHEFVSANGARTVDARAAMNFGSTLKALTFCRQRKEQDLQIIMKFDRAEFDVTLPVAGSCKEAVAGSQN